MAFVHIGRRLQSGCSAKELLGIRLAGLGQHEPEIEIGLKDVWLGSHRFTIGSNGLLSVSQPVVHKSQVKPGLKVVWIRCYHFLEKRFSRRVVALFDCAFGLGKLRGERRILFGHLVVAYGLAGTLSKKGSVEEERQNEQRSPDWLICPHSATIHSPMTHFRSIYLPEIFLCTTLANWQSPRADPNRQYTRHARRLRDRDQSPNPRS